MQTIWKFPVSPEMKVQLPADAVVLTIQAQFGEPQMWVLLDPDAPKVDRCFRAFGTGHPIESTLTVWNYVGTFQIHDGALVFHVFEVS